MQVKVFGAHELDALSRRLKDAGRDDLRKEMVKAVKKAGAPVVREMKAEVLKLPSSGGYGTGHKARSKLDAGVLSLAGRHRLDRKTVALIRRKRRATSLRRHVARTVSLRVRTLGNGAGVRIRSDGKKMPPGQQKLPKHMNKGHWRHPVFGDRDDWVDQRVPPGWFDRPAAKAGPRARREILQALEAIKRKIEG